MPIERGSRRTETCVGPAATGLGVAWCDLHLSRAYGLLGRADEATRCRAAARAVFDAAGFDDVLDATRRRRSSLRRRMAVRRLARVLGVVLALTGLTAVPRAEPIDAAPAPPPVPEGTVASFGDAVAVPGPTVEDLAGLATTPSGLGWWATSSTGAITTPATRRRSAASQRRCC